MSFIIIFQPWNNVLHSKCVRKETYTVLSRIVYFGSNFEGRVKVLPINGSLLIQNMGWGDRGRYRCFSWNNIQQLLDKMANSKKNLTTFSKHFPNVHNSSEDVNGQPRDAAQIHSDGLTLNLQIDTGYRKTLYRLSLVYGFATAGGFLLITLLAKLVCYVLHK